LAYSNTRSCFCAYIVKGKFNKYFFGLPVAAVAAGGSEPFQKAGKKHETTEGGRPKRGIMKN